MITTYQLIVDEDSMQLPEDALIECPKCGKTFKVSDLKWNYLHATMDSPAEEWESCPHCGNDEGSWFVPDAKELVLYKGEEIARELILDGYRWRYGIDPPKRFKR